jgi:hypothetical protein
MKRPYPDEDECQIWCALDNYKTDYWEEEAATFGDAKKLAIEYYKEKIYEKFQLIENMRNLKENADPPGGD